jgi:uncharacterized membrane protein
MKNITNTKPFKNNRNKLEYVHRFGCGTMMGFFIGLFVCFTYRPFYKPLAAVMSGDVFFKKIGVVVLFFSVLFGFITMVFGKKILGPKI